jgi:hypothetical protein
MSRAFLRARGIEALETPEGLANRLITAKIIFVEHRGFVVAGSCFHDF